MSEPNAKSSGLAVTGLVLGIIAAVLSFIPIINNLAFVLAILALIFGIIALAKRQSTGMGVAAIVLAVAAVIITIAVQVAAYNALQKASQDINKSIDDSTGGNTEEILGKDVQVTLGSFETSTDQYGIVKTKLPITVKNELTEAKSYVINVEAVDANGNRVLDDTVYANSLGAGQSQSFDAFSFVESSKVDALKAATFKIVSVSKM